MANSIKVTEFRLKIYPKDFNLSKKFYKETLGLQAVKEWDREESDKGIMFDVAGTILELLSTEDYHHVEGCDLSLEVLDVDQLWEDLKDSQNVVFGIRDNNWGDRSFCIADPDGFKITFFSKT